MRKKKENFLHIVPEKSENVELLEDADGKTSLIIHRTGKIERIFIYLFNQPDRVTLELDDLGKRALELIDGKRRVDEIASVIQKEFGEKAEPLYERLAGFMKILMTNKIVKIG